MACKTGVVVAVQFQTHARRTTEPRHPSGRDGRPYGHAEHDAHCERGLDTFCHTEAIPGVEQARTVWDGSLSPWRDERKDRAIAWRKEHFADAPIELELAGLRGSVGNRVLLVADHVLDQDRLSQCLLANLKS